MAKDKWANYRVPIDYQINWIHYDQKYLELAIKYINGQIEVDELSALLDYKEKFLEENIDKLGWFQNARTASTLTFVHLLLGMYTIMQSGFNLNAKSFLVALLQNEKLINKITDAIFDWRKLGAVSQTDEMNELRARFGPTGTTRLYRSSYAFYVAASHFIAKALGTLTHIDDVVSPNGR